MKNEYYQLAYKLECCTNLAQVKALGNGKDAYEKELIGRRMLEIMTGHNVEKEYA